MAAGKASFGTSMSRERRNERHSPVKLKPKPSKRSLPTSPSLTRKSVTRMNLKKTLKDQPHPLVASFQVPISGADNIRPAGMHSAAPGVPADWRENRRGYNSSRPEIRPQLLDGPGLRLHHSEESPHSAQRVFPLPHRGRLIQKNPMQSVPMMRKANFLPPKIRSVCRSRRVSQCSPQPKC